MQDRWGVVIFLVILAAFAGGGVAFVVTGGPKHLLGGLLLAIGLFAIGLARGAAHGAQKATRIISLGTRRKASLRPTTFVLWGCGVGLIGLLLLLGF